MRRRARARGPPPAGPRSRPPAGRAWQPSVPAWFEIPSADLDRAVRFYEKVLDTRLRREDMGPMRMAVFPSEKPLPTGAIVHAPGYAPAETGTVLYLNVDDIRPVLGRVPAAGGAVALPLTELPQGAGVFAQIRDSEGNRVGVFSAR
ncbi:MAG: VOC family protein [Acidobacteria bacterium]|nr:MAG: VOC family protein [Acidobacteriota bacterium]